MIKEFKIKSYKENNKKCDIITLQSNLFMEAYCRYANKTTIDDDIIQVFLSDDFDTALKLCTETQVINGIKYIAYTSTPTLQKKEESYNTWIYDEENYAWLFGEKENQKCKMLYIREDKKDFIDYFENLISLGTINNFKDKEICINKKITSRIALAFSTVNKINYMPKICIVKDKTIDIVKDIIYYTYNKDKKELIENIERGKPITNTLFDGFGLMSNKVAEMIKRDYTEDYVPDVAIIRIYGLAVKGLVLRFNWTDYVKKYCNGKFIITDIYGVKQDLREIDLILTESQCKWWNNFNSIEEYYNKIDGLNDINKELINCMYVTKTNHKKSKVKEYTLGNYQFISNLNLDFNDLMELSKDTYKLYDDILNGDLESILYYLKEFEQYEDCKIVQDKLNYLIQTNAEFLKSDWILKQIKTLVLNQIALLSSTKFYLKGNFKLLVSNPFMFIDGLLGIDRDTLSENEFYIPGNNSKKFTISRNPLASPWEIQKINTVYSKLFNEYFKDYSEEILFLNNKDWVLNSLSGADLDGDMALCIENEIIYNNVISNKTVYMHVAEGETKSMIYNEENKFKALLLSSGNKIGQLALTSTLVNNNCLQSELSKSEVRKNFNDNKNYLFYLTELQQMVIDCPKSLVMPSDEDLEPLQDYLNKRKPLFLKYKDGYNKKCKTNIKAHSYLDDFSGYIQGDILDKAENINKNGTKDYISRFLLYDNTINEQCADEIKALNKLVAQNRYNPDNTDLFKSKKDEHILMADGISKKYDYKDICNILASFYNDSFTCVYFFNDVIKMLNTKQFRTVKVLRCVDGLTTLRESEKKLIFGHYYLLEDKYVVNAINDVADVKEKCERKNKTGYIFVGKVENPNTLIANDVQVIRNDNGSIDLLKDGNKITYAFRQIKDENKQGNDTLYQCNEIDILKVKKINSGSIKVLINY